MLIGIHMFPNGKVSEKIIYTEKRDNRIILMTYIFVFIGLVAFMLYCSSNSSLKIVKKPVKETSANNMYSILEFISRYDSRSKKSNCLNNIKVIYIIKNEGKNNHLFIMMNNLNLMICLFL